MGGPVPALSSFLTAVPVEWVAAKDQATDCHIAQSMWARGGISIVALGGGQKSDPDCMCKWVAHCASPVSVGSAHPLGGATCLSLTSRPMSPGVKTTEGSRPHDQGGGSLRNTLTSGHPAPESPAPCREAFGSEVACRTTEPHPALREEETLLEKMGHMPRIGQCFCAPSIPKKISLGTHEVTLCLVGPLPCCGYPRL